jgi:hypothetical protein
MNRSILYAALERCHEHDITDDEDSDKMAKQQRPLFFTPFLLDRGEAS